MAARLPGLDPDEVYQSVVAEFLQNLQRWLQQDPTVDVVAQARTLMTFCLQHARTNEIRKRRRARDLPGDDGDEALERLTQPVPPLDDEAGAAVLRQVRGCTTPPCALCLLSLRLPDAVVREDAERAKSWRKGGAQAVPRPLDDAWGLYATGREHRELVADDVRWKDHVGVAWYTEGAVESLTEADRKAASSKVERYANRGAEDLRQALLGKTEEA